METQNINIIPNLNKQIKNNYEKINIYLTAYGPFMNIKINPSQLLCEKIILEFNKEKNNKIFNEKCSIVKNEILNVNVDFVREKMQEFHKIIEEENKKLNGKEIMHLLIHFGVHDGSSSLKLEKISKNFINDNIKYNQNICEEDPQSLECKLNIDFICKNMIEKGCNSTISEDAGTYLCNYIYYLSNKKFKENEDVYPLFIHIPNLEIISLNDLYEIFLNFVLEVKENYLLK
jgi:pyrrolidone-carboxylate peptidase